MVPTPRCKKGLQQLFMTCHKILILRYGQTTEMTKDRAKAWRIG